MSDLRARKQRTFGFEGGLSFIALLNTRGEPTSFDKAEFG
jgi:hypothetical protein